MKINFRKYSIIIVSLTIFFIGNNCFAATNAWQNGGVDHKWSTAGNWSLGHTPLTTGEDVTIDASAWECIIDVYTTLGTTNTLTLSKGTLHTDGATDNAGLSHSWGLFNSNNSNTRTLTLGNSQITVTGAGNSWVCSNTITLSSNTSSITLSGAGATFYGGSATVEYNSVSFTGSGVAYYQSGSKLGKLTRTGTAFKTDGLVFNDNPTISVALNLNGNSAINRLSVYSYTLGTPKTITLGASATLKTGSSNVDFRDITVTGGAANERNLSAITGNSGDCGGNTGITFTTSESQNFNNVAGGNWADANWTGANGNNRVPLPQDDVTFTTAFNSGVTITANMPRLGRTISFAGATATGAGVLPTLTTSISPTIYGSLNLTGLKASGLPGTNQWQFESQARTGTFTLTSNGQVFNSPVYIYEVGSILQLADSFSCGAFFVNNGTFIDAGFSVTIERLTSTSGNTRVITKTGNWKLTYAATYEIWSIVTSGLTWSDTAGTLTLPVTTNTISTLTMAGLTYKNLTIPGGGTGSVIISGSNTFTGTVTIGAPKTVLFTGGTTQQIAKFIGRGSAGNFITLGATSLSTVVPILNLTGGAWADLDYINLQGVNVTPANNWNYGTHSTNSSTNAVGYGLNFGGQSTAGDYVSAANSATANQWKSSTAFSVEAWVVNRGVGGGTYGRIISKGDDTGLGYQLQNNNGNWVFAGNFNNGSKVSGNKTVVNNTLTHLVGVWDGSNIYVYLNGSGTTGVVAAGTPLDESAENINFGNNVARTRTFDGIIYATRIYRNIALSSANISTLYNAGVKAVNPLGNATSEYLMNEGTGSTIADSVGGVTGTISGADWSNTGWGIQNIIKTILRNCRIRWARIK